MIENKRVGLRRRVLPAAAGLSVAALLLSACSAGGDSGGGDGGTFDALTERPGVPFAVEGTPQPYDPSLIESICQGDEKVKVGLAWGFQGNSWRQQTLAELEDELSKCPNVDGDLIVTVGDFDLQKSISDINSQVAQGVDVLIVMPDAGDGLIPVMRQASEAGVVVMPVFNGENFPGVSGEDYYDSSTELQLGWGNDWAKWMGNRLNGEGNVVFLGGPAGAPTSVGEFEGFKEGLEEFPGITMLTDDYTPTDWDPAKAQQAMAGLLTKYPQIDGVVTDYGTTAVSAIRAFEAANREIPPIASLSLNELACEWEDKKDANPEFDLMTLGSRPWMARIPLRRGLAVKLGAENQEPSRLAMPIMEDTTADDLPPVCIRELPLDLDVVDIQLTTDQLTELFG